MPELAWQLYITGKHKMGRYISTGATQANSCTLVGTSVCYQVNCQKYAYDGNSCWQNRVIIDTPGSYTFTVPAGVTCIRTIAVGGGGKTSHAGVSTHYGGAGGAYVEAYNTVAAGCVVTVVVGRQSQDTTISYVCSGGGTRTLTAGGGICCNPGNASGGDWNSCGGCAGCTYTNGTYCGVGNCFTTTTCCGYCLVYYGYGITYNPDNSPGCCSGHPAGGGSAGSWIWPCGGQGGGTQMEDQIVGGGYGPVAGGGGGIGYICKTNIMANPCDCVCNLNRCSAQGYPGGQKMAYMGSTSGGGGTKLQCCDNPLGRLMSFSGMCVAGQYRGGPGGWGGYDNEEGREERYYWYNQQCMGTMNFSIRHGPNPKRYAWHDIHSMCGSGSKGDSFSDYGCYRSCSDWNQGPRLSGNSWHNSGEGAGTGGIAYFCCEPTSLTIPNCMGGAACRPGINFNLLCCLGQCNRICCADRMQDQLFPYITHCAGTLGGAGGVDIMWMASRAGKGGGAGMARCYLLCVCWGGSYDNCNGGGTPLAFPPCKLDELASTAGTGMALIYWKNS